MIARVAVDVPYPRVFDYLLPESATAVVGARVRVPFGSGEKFGLIIALSDVAEVAGDKLKSVSRVLGDAPPLPAEWMRLVEFAAGYYQFPLGAAIAAALPPGLRGTTGPTRPETDRLCGLSAAGQRAAVAAKRHTVAGRILLRLAADGPASSAALRALSASAPRVLKQLHADGWLESIPSARDTRATDGPPLRTEQAHALSAVLDGLGRFQVFLLHGVTGSGKTEVYLHAIAAVLAAGRQALMLVPEIALTPQVEHRVGSRFPGAHVVSLHSELAAAARSRGFVDALAGAADIVLGTRLAVFTPLPRLGLIVVDEEHDPSFKQQEGFRYHARDLAIYRAKQAAVPIVLGSATPALETYFHARSGRYQLLHLAQRATRAALPQVRCNDTRKRPLEHGLARELLEALAQRLERGEQSLVFLNRRGYAPVLACPACGWVSRCANCAANMVVHLAARCLRCHHCAAQSALPRACPTCGNQDIHPFGRGTQRVEALLRERFPDSRILRIDRDSVRTHRAWQETLASVDRGDADILVGTQMLAKGHDFPKLTLVGVLNADASLFAADYRAPERLFSQLMQVGGRSGRAALPGEVLIQTQYPEHPLYQALARHDFAGFAAQQLAERKQAGFPPFAFQALLQADAPQLADALDFLREGAEAARGCVDAAMRIYDPVPMRLMRRARRERAQMLIESARRPSLQAFLRHWVPQLYRLRQPRGLRWHVDVDPAEI